MALASLRAGTLPAPAVIASLLDSADVKLTAYGAIGAQSTLSRECSSKVHSVLAFGECETAAG